MVQAMRCPQCGGHLELEDGHPPKKCTYCGTLLAGVSGRATAPSSGGLAAAGTVSLLLVGVVVVVVLAGGGLLAMTLLRSSPPAPPPEPVEVPVVAVEPSPVPAPPPEAAAIELLDQLYVSDIDGDGAQDVVALTEQGTDRSYVAFEGRTGKEIGRAPAPESVGTAVAVKGPFLVSATDEGQLASHDLRSGNEQWSTTLGERAMGLCESGATLLVLAEGDRKLELDLVTGRQVESQASCDRLTGERRRDPKDRRDPRAPLGTEAYVCGGVRVMGDENFVVPDACVQKVKLDPKRMEGFDPSAAWKVGEDWLVLGERTPGARVPLVGRSRRGTLLWKSEVPGQDPASAKPGAPRHVALVGELVIVAYEREGGWLTSFAFDGGERRWTVALPGPAAALGASADRLFVLVPGAGGALLLLDPSTGSELGRAGYRAP